MLNLNIIDLFKAKVHFGHLKRFVCPKMSKYIHHVNNKISIIDLNMTSKYFGDALNFIIDIIKNNGTILFVGSKKQASNVVKICANDVNMPYVDYRWLGGTLTNYRTVRQSVKKLKTLEDSVKDKNSDFLTKKEVLYINRNIEKLKLNFDGIRNMKALPDALFIIDVKYESIAVKEANKLSIPIIGIVDTNSDPSTIDYPIPGNDDSVEAINLYLSLIKDAIFSVKKNINS